MCFGVSSQRCRGHPTRRAGSPPASAAAFATQAAATAAAAGPRRTRPTSTPPPPPPSQIASASASSSSTAAPASASAHIKNSNGRGHATRGASRQRCVRCAALPNDPSWTTADTAAGGFGAEEELALVSFHIPVAGPTTEPSDVVACLDIRDSLVPRDSPLLKHDNFGGGFVDDDDRIALNTMRLSSVASSGATDMCVDLPESGILDWPYGAGVSSAWPLTHPVPASTELGGISDHYWALEAGGGTLGIRTLSPSYKPAGEGPEGAGGGERPGGGLQPPSRPPSQQGTSAAARRVPADQSTAATSASPSSSSSVQDARTGSSGRGGGGGGRSGDGSGKINRQLHNVSTLADRVCVSLPSWAMRAGPRKRIFFDPARVSAAIVTCGHICPGVNDVVQAIVHRLTDYGVPEGQVLGICDGFKGFDVRHPAKPRPLTRHVVEGAHLRGGSLLGTSKGWADIEAVVHKIALWDVNMLFVVGGDGGLRAAQLISERCRARDLPCCVVGVPKSIENDILLVDRTFGFETAVQEVQRPLLAAKVEASSIRGGIGLVKVMGRHSGFLAMQGSLSSGVVDVCLIPETKQVSFTMDGPHGLLAYLETVLERKGHAVVCVAEGAGQELINAHAPVSRDLLGNPVLHDIGVYLKARFKMHFKDAAEVRYIDPTYMIRTTACNSHDHIYARVLGHNAVDAAFSGYTGVTVGMCNNHHVMLPIPLVVQAPRRVDPWGMAWNRLRADSGQPSFHPPPSLGRVATSSVSEESEDEAVALAAAASAAASASEGSPSPSSASSAAASPQQSVADAHLAGGLGSAQLAAAGEDAASATSVMTSLAAEPSGPQNTLSGDATAGSQGLPGGGAAISPPPPEPADVTGQQLAVLATEPEPANLPWPAAQPPPSEAQKGSSSGGGGGGGGVVVTLGSLGGSLGGSGDSMGSTDAAPPRGFPGGGGGGGGGAARRVVEQETTPEAVPAARGLSSADDAPAVAAEHEASTEAAAPSPGVSPGSETVNTQQPQHQHGGSGPLGALGAVIRSVTGGSGGGSGGCNSAAKEPPPQSNIVPGPQQQPTAAAQGPDPESAPRGRSSPRGRRPERRSTAQPLRPLDDSESE